MIIISAQAFPPKPGGIQNLLAGTAEYIARAGHKVLVLADGGTEARAWQTKVDLPYDVEWFSGPKPIRRWLKARRIQALAKSERVDALYADTWKSLEPLTKPVDFPILTWGHGNEFRGTGKRADRLRAALAKADHIIFNSIETKDRAAVYTSDDTNWSIVNPPVFPPVKATELEHQSAEQRWSKSGPRLVALCRLIEWKGLDQAIRAMPAVLEKIPDAQFLIAGKGDDLGRLQGIATELNLGDAVKFIGWIEGGAKTAFLESGHLFLQPGRQVVEEREGYGISYVEAALHGLPSISGNAGGAPEALIDGQTGLVIDAEVTKNVSQAILSILCDDAKLEAMKQAALNHGQANLWENQVRKLLECAGLKS